MGLKFYFFLWLSILPSFGASWYFDNSASGANNGTSWANAWQATNDINWSGSGIVAGDTLYISGGTTTKSYPGGLFISKNGTYGNRITVKIGQDTGHNGVADFGTNSIYLDAAANYVTVDGNRGLGYSNPTNWAQVESGEWTNNIGFWSHDRRQDTLASSILPPWQYFTEPADNITIRYFYVSGYTNHHTGGSSGLDERGQLVTGAYENFAPTNHLFEFLKFTRNSGRQFAYNGTTNEFYDGMIVQFCLIEYGGEDYFQVGRGFTVKDSVIGPVAPDDVHCDYFQNTFGWFKVYNNYVREAQHSYMRLQSNAGKNPAIPTVNGNIMVYNNIFSAIPGRSYMGDTWNEHTVFVNEDSSVAKGGYVTWSNVWFFNNTYYGQETNLFKAPPQLPNNPVIAWTKGTYVTNGYLKDIHFVNNIFDIKYKGNAFPSTTNISGMNGFGIWYNYEPFTTNDFVFTHNIQSGTNYDAVDGHFKHSYLDIVTNIYQHPYRFNNRTNRPSFVNATSGNFELASGDVEARDNGMDITGMVNYDTLNRPRKVGSGVDIGAFEAQETSLVLYLSFDNDASNTNATDDSGHGYTGKRFNLSEYGYPSNKIYNASGAPALVNRPNFTGRYSDFLWRTNNGTYNPTYLDDGSFFAVTNIEAAVTNLSQITVMTWARYDNANRTDVNSPSYDDDGNSQLISAGTATGTKGSWFLGRYNQRIWLNNTRFVIQTNEGFSGGTSFGTVGDPVIGYGSGNQVIFEFPDRGFDQNGNTTNWAHYAATFSNGVVRTYFNGAAITNHTLSTMSVVNIGRGSRPYNWIGIGVNTHVGTPEFDNESGTDYPNNGWLNGAMDQVRIYNRSLTQQEVIDVANSEGAAFADAPSGPVIEPNISLPFRKIKGLNLKP